MRYGIYIKLRGRAALRVYENTTKSRPCIDRKVQRCTQYEEQPSEGGSLDNNMIHIYIVKQPKMLYTTPISVFHPLLHKPCQKPNTFISQQRPTSMHVPHARARARGMLFGKSDFPNEEQRKAVAQSTVLGKVPVLIILGLNGLMDG
jgi:hypothetical protein